MQIIIAILLFVLVGPAPQPVSRARATSVRKSIRVMSYNIHVGMGMDKKLDLARIADVITRARPDLVGLQEVDRGVTRTERVDQIKELGRLTKMEYAFAHNLDYQGGQYGVAVLSRFPILSIDHRRYQHLREAERRGFLRVEVRMGNQNLSFVTTHLDYQHADNRLFETKQLLAALSDVDTPIIVAGDFNDDPTGESYKLMLQHFSDVWVDAGKGLNVERLTYPSDKPIKTIDYIFYRKQSRMVSRAAKTIPSLASDHLPVLADIDIEKQ